MVPAFLQKEVIMLERLPIEDFDKVYQLMEESFPADEYRPLSGQLALFENPAYTIYALYHTNRDIKAFIAVWEFDTLVYVEHFAVNPSYRNGGLGSQVLSNLQKLYRKPVCLEVEPPETDMAKRRIGFYERNGFFFNDYPYMQPAMAPDRNPIPLSIMTSNHAVTEEEFLQIKNLLYREVYHQ